MLPLEKLQHLAGAAAWPGHIPLYSIYTLGIAGERFFRALKDSGKLLGTLCTSCSLTYMPPRLYCEQCFADLSESWTEVSRKGVVHTFTLAYYNLDGERLGHPDILAMVKLEGAHGGLVHRLGEVEPSAVAIGMAVEMVLKPKGRRRGSISDIRCFRPLGRRRLVLP